MTSNGEAWEGGEKGPAQDTVRAAGQGWAFFGLQAELGGWGWDVD